MLTKNTFSILNFDNKLARLSTFVWRVRPQHCWALLDTVGHCWTLLGTVGYSGFAAVQQPTMSRMLQKCHQFKQCQELIPHWRFDRTLTQLGGLRPGGTDAADNIRGTHDA